MFLFKNLCQYSLKTEAEHNERYCYSITFKLVAGYSACVEMPVCEEIFHSLVL